MTVLYRKGTNQGNADFFSRIIDLGDGTHAVRLVVDEQEWNDAEFCSIPEDQAVSRCFVEASICSIHGDQVVPTLPVGNLDPEPPEDPYRHNDLPPVSLAELRTHQEQDPLCQAISNHALTGLLPPDAPDGPL